MPSLLLDETVQWHEVANHCCAVKRKRRTKRKTHSEDHLFAAKTKRRCFGPLAARRPSQNTATAPRDFENNKTSQFGLEKDLLLSNDDVASHILSFLDVKSLYRFSLASKSCMKLLGYDNVVRAALFHGGHAKTNVERVIGLIRSRRIVVPSPRRMLRLCVGRLCELCQRNRVNFVSKHFGVFFCKDCTENGGYVTTLRRFDPLYPHVSHLYAIPDGCHALKVWGRPFVDRQGERCGPLSTLRCHVKPHEPGLHAFQKQDHRRLEEWFPLIEQSYKDNVENAKSHLTATRMEKMVASFAAQEKKNRRVLWALDHLSRELGDVPWKQQVLAHEWVEYRGKERLEFVAPLANDILGPDISAPSRLSHTSIKRLAVALHHAMAMFEEQGLHDFSFLSHECAAERDFKKICREVFPDYSLLSKPWVNYHILDRLQYLHPVNRFNALSRSLSYQLAMEARGLESEERRAAFVAEES